MDDKNIQRKICVSTWQTAKTKKYLCVVQVKMSTLWDNVNINLAKVTNALFGTTYVETVRIKVSGRCHRQTAALFLFTIKFYFLFLLLFHQIHASCRIRSVYFTDRLYSDQELPSDYRAEENKTAPNLNTVMSDMSSAVPGGPGHLGHREALHKPTAGIALQTTASGEEYIGGLHTILNSIGHSPPKFWKQEVSIFETMNSVSS